MKRESYSFDQTVLYEMDMTACGRVQKNEPVGLLLPLSYQKRIKEVKHPGRKREIASSGVLLVYAISHRLHLTWQETVRLLELHLALGPHGKPYLQQHANPRTVLGTAPANSSFPPAEPSQTYRNLHFNLSHSGTKVLLALSHQPVGVDIQRIDHQMQGSQPFDADIQRIDHRTDASPEKRHSDIAHRFFTEAEQRMLDQCADQEERDALFFRLWVIKESYIKATGEGMSRPLRSFEPDSPGLEQLKNEPLRIDSICEPDPRQSSVQYSQAADVLHHGQVLRIKDLKGLQKDWYVSEYADHTSHRADTYARCLCLQEPWFPETVITITDRDLIQA